MSALFRLGPAPERSGCAWRKPGRAVAQAALTRRFVCLLAWGLCCVGQAFAQDNNNNNNPLDVFLNGLETFSADFEQVLIDPSGEALELSKGAVSLRRPGMFYWLYNEPYTQKIISDGATLWIYEHDLEQVTISDVGEGLADTPALIFSGERDLYDHYLVEELENDAGNALLELTPKNPEAQYRLLRLSFRNNELSGMTLLDNLGQTLLLTFADARRNPELNKALFRFVPADDMEVIDARQRLP